MLAISPVKAAPSEEPKKLPIVFVARAEKVELFDRLTYPARLLPMINATVLAESDGVVKKFTATLGTQVKKGQTLVKILNTDPVYKYAAANVTAPVSGVVSGVEVTEGTLVQKGQALLRITDPSNIRITIEVAVSDLSAIHQGLKGQLTLHSHKEPFSVEVVGVSPYVDPGTGTATAELKLLDKTQKLPPGLVGKVQFRGDVHQGIEVPEYAIFYQGKEPSLRLVTDGKISFSPVKLGNTRRGMVEVLSGLSPGSMVVVRASSYVADGEMVEVQTLKSHSE